MPWRPASGRSPSPWGHSRWAGPALLPVEDLARLDFFRNFPHLALPVATLTDETRGVLARGEATAPSGENTLVPTGNCLPTATCYGLLLSLAGRRLQTPEVITSIGRCFRNEDHYDGLPPGCVPSTCVKRSTSAAGKAWWTT